MARVYARDRRGRFASTGGGGGGMGRSRGRQDTFSGKVKKGRASGTQRPNSQNKRITSRKGAAVSGSPKTRYVSRSEAAGLPGGRAASRRRAARITTQTRGGRTTVYTMPKGHLVTRGSQLG